MGAELLASLMVTLAVGRGFPEAARDDAADVEAAAAGDQMALARLYDRHASLVFSLALRITGERAAAEEVTQDVFLQLWRRSAAFDPARGDVTGWLVTITRNRAIDRLRSAHGRETQSWVALIEDDRPFVHSKPAQVRLADTERVARALATLPEQQRKVLEMAYYEGFTQSEIAGRLNEPLGTVKTWTRSALKSLRGALQS